MIERKRRGEKIHTNEAILSYQKSLLRNEPVEWTCNAGYKAFLRFRAGEVLDLQHGPHREAHHGHHAG